MAHRSPIVFYVFIAFVALCEATDNVCPQYGQYRVANPRSETSFFVCSNGYPELKYCPRGYYFDSQSAECVPVNEYRELANNVDYDNGDYRNTRGLYANPPQSQYNQNGNYNAKYSPQQQQNTRSYQQQRNYDSNGQQQQQQSSRNYQQNGYGNNAQLNTRNYQQQQKSYINNGSQQRNYQQQNNRGYQQQQQQNYRSSQSQSRNTQQQFNARTELETDVEVNRQGQDWLRPSSNRIERVICPRVIIGNAVLMPNDEDQTQTTYYVCQKSGARRLLRCPQGTKFNVGLKVCYRSSVSTQGGDSRSVSRKHDSQHW